MKRGIERKNTAKEELSIQDGDHDLPRLRLLASRNSPGLSLLSFTPTLGLFVVQSRNSRDPWESTWESDSMGLIVFSTGKCAVTRLHVHILWVCIRSRVCLNATNQISDQTKISRKDYRAIS